MPDSPHSIPKPKLRQPRHAAPVRDLPTRPRGEKNLSSHSTRAARRESCRGSLAAGLRLRRRKRFRRTHRPRQPRRLRPLADRPSHAARCFAARSHRRTLRPDSAGASFAGPRRRAKHHSSGCGSCCRPSGRIARRSLRSQHRVFPSHRRSCSSHGRSPALVPTLLGQGSRTDGQPAATRGKVRLLRARRHPRHRHARMARTRPPASLPSISSRRRTRQLFHRSRLLLAPAATAGRRSRRGDSSLGRACSRTPR